MTIQNIIQASTVWDRALGQTQTYNCMQALLTEAGYTYNTNVDAWILGSWADYTEILYWFETKRQAAKFHAVSLYQNAPGAAL